MISRSVDEERAIVFVGCTVALFTAAFGFVLRAQLLDAFGAEFALTGAQQGTILGAGVWPFAITIVAFSLTLRRLGGRVTLGLAAILHAASVARLVSADGYHDLWFGAVLGSLGDGTVEAVINPLVARLYPRAKTQWLNILHAGWPFGLCLGAVAAVVGAGVDWRWLLALPAVPLAVYCSLLLTRPLPVVDGPEDAELAPSEDSGSEEFPVLGSAVVHPLQIPGGVGMALLIGLLVAECGRVAGELLDTAWPLWGTVWVAATCGLLIGRRVGGSGHPLFLLLLLLMIPVATTEVATDGWITPIMAKTMGDVGWHPSWVLAYTAALTGGIRLFAGPLVRRFAPLWILCGSCIVSAGALVLLADATGWGLLLAATLFGLGKAYLWPTMLGVTADRFPEGGAVAINAMGGVGMLSVGVLSTVALGTLVDGRVVARLQVDDPRFEPWIREQPSVFGFRPAVDREGLTQIPDPQLATELQAVLKATTASVRQESLTTVAWIPAVLALAFGVLAILWRRQARRAARCSR